MHLSQTKCCKHACISHVVLVLHLSMKESKTTRHYHDPEKIRPTKRMGYSYMDRRYKCVGTAIVTPKRRHSRINLAMKKVLECTRACVCSILRLDTQVTQGLPPPLLPTPRTQQKSCMRLMCRPGLKCKNKAFTA